MIYHQLETCAVHHIHLFSRSLMSDSLQPHGLQHTRLPCPSPSPRACSNSCPLSQWCHPTISSSVIPFSSHLQSFPASGSFLMSRLFASGGQVLDLPSAHLKEGDNTGLPCSWWWTCKCIPLIPSPSVPKVVLNHLLLPAKRSGQLLLMVNFYQTHSRVILLYIPLSTPLKPFWNNLIT